MPMTKVDNEHDQLISMLNQLMDDRDMLTRENEYLKAKLNESILIETISEMKKERDILFKLLANLTNNSNKNEQIKPNYVDLTLNGKLNSTISRHNRVHRLKTNPEQPTNIHRIENPEKLSSPSTSHMKRSQSNKKIFIYKPQTQLRKVDVQLKHSQNSPFQHYRSQSLQDLT